MKRLRSQFAVFLFFTLSACHTEFSPLDPDLYGPAAGQYILFQMDGHTHSTKNVTAQRTTPPGTIPLGIIRAEFQIGDTVAYLDMNINIPNDTLIQVQQVTLRFGREDNTAMYYRGGVSHTFKFVSSSVIEGAFSGVVRGLAGTVTEGKEKALKDGYLSVRYIQR